ncbi:MAG: hypothetical protein BWX73_00309 [Lentisphaerae bacterium ADurb.Bin082]|nr:MAG: hypothetical protein BWX73_00309 [Lentisphaerae bacterium ADurb.Bin082]HQL86528.1 hypothetical protein [Lentisphaeria bacterium]
MPKLEIKVIWDLSWERVIIMAARRADAPTESWHVVAWEVERSEAIAGAWKIERDPEAQRELGACAIKAADRLCGIVPTQPQIVKAETAWRDWIAWLNIDVTIMRRLKDIEEWPEGQDKRRTRHWLILKRETSSALCKALSAKWEAIDALVIEAGRRADGTKTSGSQKKGDGEPSEGCAQWLTFISISTPAALAQRRGDRFHSPPLLRCYITIIANHKSHAITGHRTRNARAMHSHHIK